MDPISDYAWGWVGKAGDNGESGQARIRGRKFNKKIEEI